MKSIKEVLAKNLKINRLKLGLTQEKLAEKAEISTHYLAMVELAHKFPSANMLECLATALEIEPHELFYVPSTAENTLSLLKQDIIYEMTQLTANMEQVVAKTVKESLVEQKI
ncbi:MAG: helix-turn-helix domain-containing protein [Treponema sp.]|jgi:transcriptional regulator with XRE-family HTH domain|nr:helix-turn-helix domain-containing protein [Treponema sp.]